MSVKLMILDGATFRRVDTYQNIWWSLFKKLHPVDEIIFVLSELIELMRHQPSLIPIRSL